MITAPLAAPSMRACGLPGNRTEPLFEASTSGAMIAPDAVFEPSYQAKEQGRIKYSVTIDSFLRAPPALSIS
jgi:hypothetical protein